jgi:HEAT repeat protein
MNNLVLVIGCRRDPNAGHLAKLSDPSAEVRRAACRSLGDHPSPAPEIIAALAETCADEDAEVRRLSAYSLGKVGPPAKDALPALEAGLKDSESAVRIAAAQAIERIDPSDHSFIPVLIAAMRAGDGRVIREAGMMGNQAEWAVPALIELLSNEQPQVRALAAQTLGRIGQPARGTKAAIERATHDSSPTVQDAARKALEEIPAS